MRAIIIGIMLLGVHCSWAQQVIKVTGKLRLLTITHDTTEIELSQYHGLILFSSNTGCSKCYENLNTFLSNTPSLDTLALFGIINMNNCLSCRREFIKQYEIFDQCDRIFFDLNSQTNDSTALRNTSAGIWHQFSIGRSPALGFVKNGNLYLFTYDNIFTGLALSPKFQSAIAKLLD